MRIGLMVGVMLLFGAQTGPALAGMLGSAIAADLPCLQRDAASRSHPLLCQGLASVLLGPASGLGLSVIGPAGPAPLAFKAPVHPVPVAVTPTPHWRAHMDKVVAGYDAAFTGGDDIVLPAVPAVLWPGGNPFDHPAE